MSIIIQFNSPSYIQSAGVPSNIPCHSKKVKLEMVPGIEHSDIPIMTDDEGSVIDITKNGVFSTTLKDVRTSHYCFGLPYQDHNYGAPPPPTPPSYSPCPSPAAVVAVANEDSNHSVASTTTEEAPEESVTRCICGFEHDDEYMICCDNCLVWQHIDCMGLDRSNIPETYLCEKCEPRKLDRHKAKLLQARKKSVLTKLPPAKQELNANNLIFGKNYKKKTLLHSPEQWQHVNTASQPQRFYGSTDSDEDAKNNERRPKTRSKRRKREEEKDTSLKKNKSMTKHGRERMEIKRSRLRRNKNKESTSTADEEAQDAWAYSVEWCEENFESAVTNQYTPEVQHLARMLRPQGHEKKFFDQLRSKQCHILDDGKKKQLVSLYDIPRIQPLIEYKGKYLLASQFHDLHPLYNKRLYPYIMFYTVDQTEICVDSSMYGNDARFVRRSCKPNAEIRHMSFNGNLHLFLQSTKVIFSEDEITVALNFNQCDSLKDVVCACGAEDCFLKPKKRNGSVEVCQEKRRRTRRSTISAEDDSSQSIVTVVPPEKIKTSPVKIEIPEPPVPHAETNEPVIDTKPSSDHETEEPSIEDKKKMTREQRKIEAYMRAFNQMEKAQRRKQQALERQKAHQPKTEESPEKSECTENFVVKEEEKPPVDVPEVPPEKEDTVEEEVKVVQPPAPPKPKKGKRRRGSGTPSRRRTRTNSGGSDILPTLEEIKQIVNEPEAIAEPPAPIPEPVSEPAIVAPCPIAAPSSPTPSSAEESPKALKTKRLLLQEWLLEKSEEATSSASASSSSPRSIHTELKWNTTAASATCYVRCTKDTPHSGGISAAHLRRSNSSGHLRAGAGQGSAKKRWLRQAMHDCPEEPLGIDLSIMEHLESSCLSPSCHGDVDSPGGAADDIITPLKKRRLMRESIESLSSPHSPSLENGMDDTDATTSSLTNDMQIDQRIDTLDQQLLCAANEDSVQPSPMEEEDSTCKVNDKHEFEEAEESQVKDEILNNESTPTAIITEVNCNKEDIDTDDIECSKTEETPMEIDCQIEKQITCATLQTDCDVHPVVNGKECGETIEDPASPILTLDNDTKPNSLNQDLPDSKPNADSECHVNSIGALKSEPLDPEVKPSSNEVKPLSKEARSPSKDVTSSSKNITLSKDVTSSSKDISSSPKDITSSPKEVKSSPKEVESSSKEVTSLSKEVTSSSKEVTHNSVNQSVKTIKAKDTNNENTLAQKQSLDSCAAPIASSPVHKISPIEIKSTSPITHCFEPVAEVESPEKMSIKQFSLVESSENHTSNSQSPMQKLSDSSPTNEINPSEANAVAADKTVNREDHSTNDRPPNLSVTFEKTVCSNDSSCSSIADSNSVDSCFKQAKQSIDYSTDIVIKANGVKDTQVRFQCMPEEDISPVKACASATQKRKVSLSEYRMRMRENSGKGRTNSDLAKNSVDGISVASRKRAAQVTLAPLPLFDVGEDQANKQSVVKNKKDSTLNEEDDKEATSEHRENLNERLKREFGFDLSEDSTSFLQPKSKCNNQSSSDPPSSISTLPLDPQSLPPPPPPPRGVPRPLRAPHPVMGGAPMPIPASPYGYVHPPFSRPPYIIPQVPGAPYIAPQPPPILPPIHQMALNANAPCNLRAPLLPSTHSFTPAMPGTLMRTPTRHAPVNAQRFATMVPPPRVSHKAYPHVYQSGLYK